MLVLLRMLLLGVALHLAKSELWPRLCSDRPALVVEVAHDASERDVQSAVETALLTELALESGVLHIDPVAKEELLRSMRALEGGASSDERVLLEQAVALGLHQADSVVRERLRFAGEELLMRAAAPEEPSRNALEVYLARNALRYARKPVGSFALVVLRGTDDRARERARALRETFVGLDLDTALARNEQPSIRTRMDGMSEAALAQIFGRDAAQALFACDADAWCGPLASPHGQVLAYVREVRPGTKVALKDVEARVRSDYAHDRRAQRLEDALRALRQARGVEVVRSST